METQTNSAFESLKVAFPSIPEDRLLRCFKRCNGNVERVQGILKGKLERTEKIASKYNLKGDDIRSLCQKFSELGLRDIARGLEVANGDLAKTETVLEERKGNGKHHGHRKHRHERIHEQLGVDVTALVGQYKKLYPEIPEEKLKRIAQRSCSKLKHIGKKLQHKGKKCSSQKSSKECERSRSRRHHKNRCHAEKPANFDELLHQLKAEFPSFDERKLSKILQRNQFNVEKAKQRAQHKLYHRKHREGIEDELLLKDIPSNVTRVIVDGNNLLFVNEIIRGITIRSGIARGTQALSKLISVYNSIEKKNILVVYDQGHGKFNVENITIDIARPKYESSDDYLVALCQSMTSGDKETSMFVTSDIGLKQRLLEKGSKNIMKSGRFVKICESKIPNVTEILQQK